MVAGVVRARTVAAAHITPKAIMPTNSRKAFAVKTSAKIQTLSTMLTIGSTITMNGCEKLSEAHVQGRLIQELGHDAEHDQAR